MRSRSRRADSARLYARMHAWFKEAIAELQSHGYPIPDYPETPKTDAEKDAKAEERRQALENRSANNTQLDSVNELVPGINGPTSLAAWPIDRCSCSSPGGMRTWMSRRLPSSRVSPHRPPSRSA